MKIYIYYYMHPYIKIFTDIIFCIVRVDSCRYNSSTMHVATNVWKYIKVIEV
jgi:hypothetical protein